MTNNTSDFSSEDVRKAQALAPQLDPDIARAITEGNGPVIQAIANGAATDTQIAERLISMGLTTGLPPGVQQMVNEQMQLAADKREAEVTRSERLEKLASGAFGMGLTGGEGNNGHTGSSGSLASGVRPISEMSMAERTVYFNGLLEMSNKEWRDIGHEARHDHIQNLSEHSEKKMEEANEHLHKLYQDSKADLGSTKQTHMMDAFVGLDLSKPENQEIARQRVAKLPPEERMWAEQILPLNIQVHGGAIAVGHAGTANVRNNEGKLEESKGHLGEGIKTVQQSTDAAARLACGTSLTPEQMAEMNRKRDAANDAKVDAKSHYDTASIKERRQIDEAKISENKSRRTIFSKLDASAKMQTAAAGMESVSLDDLGAEAAPPPRLTIDGAALAPALAALGAPEQKAANDVHDPALKTEAPKVAQAAPVSSNNS